VTPALQQLHAKGVRLDGIMLTNRQAKTAAALITAMPDSVAVYVPDDDNEQTSYNAMHADTASAWWSR
jgi:hypothetical protein